MDIEKENLALKDKLNDIEIADLEKDIEKSITKLAKVIGVGN